MMPNAGFGFPRLFRIAGAAVALLMFYSAVTRTTFELLATAMWAAFLAAVAILGLRDVVDMHGRLEILFDVAAVLCALSFMTHGLFARDVRILLPWLAATFYACATVAWAWPVSCQNDSH